MKKLSKIKLTQLSQNELESRQMGSLLGGGCCACACAGLSSDIMNNYFNDEGGYGQSGGSGNCACGCCGGESEWTQDWRAWS